MKKHYWVDAPPRPYWRATAQVYGNRRDAVKCALRAAQAQVEDRIACKLAEPLEVGDLRGDTAGGCENCRFEIAAHGPTGRCLFGPSRLSAVISTYHRVSSLKVKRALETKFREEYEVRHGEPAWEALLALRALVMKNDGLRTSAWSEEFKVVRELMYHARVLQSPWYSGQLTRKDLAGCLKIIAKSKWMAQQMERMIADPKLQESHFSPEVSIEVRLRVEISP